MPAGRRWPPSLLLVLAAALGPSTTAARAAEDEPPGILVSRQLLASERLAVGDVVSLSSDPSGTRPRAFRIAGAYEPTPDPARLGGASLEARLHLPDLIALTRDPADPSSGESVGAINVRLADPGDAEAFARDLSARLPGLVVRPTRPPKQAGDAFVVLDRFHLAIALVTVIASSIFLLALMVMLVDERREMVAVLRLIGLRRRRILLQVFVEGLLIAAAGALSGIVLAAALQGGFNHFFQWRYDTALVFVRITPSIVWRSVLLAVPLGALASLAASWSLLRRGILSLARR
jgi:putative ABC transport system permease protein